MSYVSRRTFLGACTQVSAAAAAAVGVAGLAGCSDKGAAQGSVATVSASTKAAESEKLTVFAAASLTESLTAIGEAFKKQYEADLAFNFDSSGTLATQITEGASCDVFISAGQKQMNTLDAEADKDPGEQALIDHSTRFDILENKVTLAVPDDNPKAVENFDDMAKKLGKHELLLAMGNSDVPVGQYTQKILAYYNLDEKSLANASCISYGSNVKEVTTQVKEGAVDCGVIYKTDAVSAGLKMVDEASEDMCGRVVYPAAVVATSEHKDLAQEFLNFCKSNDGSTEFEKVGFTPLA